MRASPIKRRVCVVLSLDPVFNLYAFACHVLFCVLRVTTNGFVQCFSLSLLWNLYAYVCHYVIRTSPHKHRVSAVLARRFPLEFCTRGFFYVLRASPRKHQVCRAVLAPRFPLKFCTRVFMFWVLRLANTGFVQCFSLGPFWVCTLVFVTFCLTIIGFVQCFSLGSLLKSFYA